MLHGTALNCADAFESKIYAYTSFILITRPNNHNISIKENAVESTSLSPKEQSSNKMKKRLESDISKAQILLP